MQGKRKYIIILALLGIYIVAMFAFFGKDFLKNQSEELYLVTSPDTFWKLEKEEWMNVTNTAEYSMKEFTAYTNQTYFGEYDLVYNDKFYLFDSQKKSHRFTGDLLAFRGNVPIDVIPFSSKEAETSDHDLIEKILKENNIDTSYEKIKKWKTKIDINGDKREEMIYSIHNVFEADVGTYSFGMVFIVDQDKISYLYKNIEPSSHAYSTCMPYLKNVLDLRKDGKYEFIVSCQNYGSNGACNMLYDNQTKKYKLLKNC